jgi:cell wall-associated NlpC family hydrolase
VLAVASVASLPAAAISPIDATRAEAQQVYNEIQGLNENLSRADELINLANLRLKHVEYEQSINRRELAIARSNLTRSQRMVARRLVSLYTSSSPSTLDMILGATSLGSLLTRIDDANHVSSLDGQVIAEVQTFKAAVRRDASRLVAEHADASALVTQRRDEQISISNELAQRQQLLSSIHGQIATLEAQAAAAAAAAQARLAQQAQQRIQAQQAAQEAAAQAQVVGATAAAPAAPNTSGATASTAPAGAAPPSTAAVSAATASGGTVSVLPASPYGSQVVSIAMSFLGVPYVWGGASPSGFDCSGLVMYAYAQVGVSLPHSSYAMWGYGEPVPENELQPGDIVFFDGLGHVGLYIGGGEFVNAPFTGSVVSVASLNSGWAAAAYVGARRIP